MIKLNITKENPPKQEVTRTTRYSGATIHRGAKPTRLTGFHVFPFWLWLHRLPLILPRPTMDPLLEQPSPRQIEKLLPTSREGQGGPQAIPAASSGLTQFLLTRAVRFRIRTQTIGIQGTVAVPAHYSTAPLCVSANGQEFDHMPKFCIHSE